jgi:hypothetical protein
MIARVPALLFGCILGLSVATSTIAGMIEGHFDVAERSFEALALEAPTEAQRTLAREMANLSRDYATRRARESMPSVMRSTDELTLLYASAFLYGAGTGTWFLLQVKPDSAVTATLPFAAFTAAPVVAVATIDAYRKLPRGVPHAISAGLYLGLGEGVWLVGYQHARGARLREGDPSSEVRWSPETTATVLWGGATAGAVLGGLLAGGLVTTPGRVSFTASTTLWAGAVFGLGAGALLPDDDRRRERAFLLAGAGYNAALAGGLLLAGEISPSVARVRLVDLAGLGGTLLVGGLYLSSATAVDVRAAEGFAALGAGAGLAAGWLLTSGMPKETPGVRVPLVTAQPALQFVQGGATLGVGGAL